MQTNSPRSHQKFYALGLVVIAAVVVASGILSRRSQAEQLKASADQRAVPTVALLTPSLAKGAPMELQARIEPWAQAPIYARVSGYLKRWHVDIGGKVKAGQLLGEIETPDLDQQLLQAKAELGTARSNLSLAASTSQRWQGLLAADAVSQQEADEKAGDLAARQSVLNAMQANVDRVQALQRYTRLVAPFDGVVTARRTDVGALINNGGAQGDELFVVSDVRKLRVYVSVPQRQVAQIRSGGKAKLSVPERPGQTFDATVQSLSQAIDINSGAMLVQLTVDNKLGELLPGGYATVRFPAPDLSQALSVPPGALIINQKGVQVATVDGRNRVLVKHVTIARDLGNVIELSEGIAANDKVIGNPPDGIANGDIVRIAAAPKAVP
jgi:RND family efflux transporter MFP subunit